ncbi:hypothetical protein HSBAA_46610 [Vreelandella sulfidaeris]|uniref:Sel1 repeat family protein n=1 Tax=Vreelandella sulfidaeris TaxID=115553 RepID=A0A455UBE6_9GAMM|nr:hypothetical protein HSBAA_46610 [Halomonas sulfidaeris]
MLAALLMWSLNSWALPADIQAAKDEGMRLWGLSEWIEMQPYLEQCAEAGDVESMYYLGEATRLLSRGLTTEAMEWYLKAAEQGDPYAMLRLFQGGACIGGECPEDSDDWREAALDITLPKAEAGDPEAMLAMYYIYANLDASRLTFVYNFLGIPTRAGKWLKRAAEAGLPEAQTRWGAISWAAGAGILRKAAAWTPPKAGLVVRLSRVMYLPWSRWIVSIESNKTLNQAGNGWNKHPCMVVMKDVYELAGVILIRLILPTNDA